MKASDLGIVVGKEYKIDWRRVRVFKGQPRSYFDKTKMAELEASIKMFQQQEPGKVRLIDEESCELVEGERRWRICKKLDIPFKAVVDDIPDVKTQFLRSVISNAKEGLTELENLRAIERIKNDFPDLSLSDIGAAFSQNAGWVRDRLRLKELPKRALDLMDPELTKGQPPLSVAKALELLKERRPEVQLSIARNTVLGGLNKSDVRRLVQEHGDPHHTTSWSPRQEYDRLDKLLRRVLVDSELILERPSKHFEQIFDNRSPSDLTDMLAMAIKAKDNLS